MQKPPRHLLSKSTFMYGCQCPKRLWLHKFMPSERDEQDEAQTAFFQQGTDIGLLAQQRFPNGVDASPETFFEYQKSVVKTAELIEAGKAIIYEAAFQFNGILCAIDILVKEKNKWYAYEVKSSTSAKDTFIKDAALQYYVITNSGIELEDIFILHLNSDYVRYGPLNLNELFTSTSVKEQVLDLQPFIKQKELELKTVLKLSASPEIEMGNQCHKPYDCDFIGYCSKSIETALHDFGEENIDRVAIQEFVDQLKYPLYFMDFETWSSPIPEQDGHWPYRQVPFQFSLHIQNEPNAEVEHFEYLAENTESSLEDFANALFKNIGDDGSVVVYNQTFENMILNQLKDDIEDAKDAIENIQSRFFDLMYAFRKKYYYTPKMQGSYSIKYVLPALIPELQYSDLAIGNGGDASAAFYNLKNETDPSKVIEIRNALLEYCGLDTLAMVKILEKLMEK